MCDRYRRTCGVRLRGYGDGAADEVLVVAADGHGQPQLHLHDAGRAADAERGFLCGDV